MTSAGIDFYCEYLVGPAFPHSELEEAMLIMPYHYVAKLLPYLLQYLKSQVAVERSCRCLFFLLRCVSETLNLVQQPPTHSLAGQY